MFEIVFTAAIVLITSICLALELSRPAYILFAALFLLFGGGVISLEETLTGFSNQGMLTVAVLYILATTLQSSTGFLFLINQILGSGSTRSMYLRLMLPVTLLSAFLNNTPVVASLISPVKRWCTKNNISPSKLMIPLSYAAIFGGMCTLIGSSTNLVVHGLLLEMGHNGFSFFEIGKVGLPVVIFLTLYFVTVGQKLLPERTDSINILTENTREYMVEVRIEEGCPFIGKNVEEANLRHLRGLYLFQINRNDREIAPLNPQEILQLNDRLFFTGLPETIYDLLKTPGFRLVKDHEFDVRNIDSDKHKTYEAVISNNSPLLGLTVRESGFRSRYNAVILAIHRNGHRINQKVGDIEFQANDTLFILADKDFEKNWFQSPDFSLVSQRFQEYSKPRLKGNLAMILVTAMIIAVATGLIKSMLVAAVITAGVLLISRVISFHDAKKAIDMEVLLVIVASLGIGRAVYNSGIADLLADYLIRFLEPFGKVGIIAGIFFLTSFYTEIITNNASAAIIFPFAWASASKIGLAPEPLMITLAIAASSSFATPIGYQTNMMVYGPGGYKFRDFLKTGIVVNLLTGIFTTIVVYLLYLR